MDQLGDEVARELARFGPAPRMMDLVARWPAAVGGTIARNAFPARLSRDGVLHVATSSSTWAFELAQLAPTVLARLHAELGDGAPRAIRFAVGRVPGEPPPDAEARAAALSPGPAEVTRAGELAAAIEDPDLRSLVARAAAASLARGASDRSF